MYIGNDRFTSEMNMSITLKEALSGSTAANKVRNQEEAYIAVWNP